MLGTISTSIIIIVGIKNKNMAMICIVERLPLSL